MQSRIRPENWSSPSTSKASAGIWLNIRFIPAGRTKGLAVVGRWRSADGRVFYLAVGGRFDKSGEPIRP